MRKILLKIYLRFVDYALPLTVAIASLMLVGGMNYLLALAGEPRALWLMELLNLL